VTLFTVLRTATGRWGIEHFRDAEGKMTYREWQEALELRNDIAPWPRGNNVILLALAEAARSVFQRADFYRFSNFLFSTFLSFLLPILSLSFATDAVGSDRESGNLIWLLTRPLPRPTIYLAKFIAVLPWTLLLNVGGFAIICLTAGKPGRMALSLYWPSVCCGTLAFSALYLWIGAAFRRPAVVAIVYSFFLETIFGNLPGYLKRASISFYTRCMMFSAAKEYDVQPEKPSIYLAVDGETALMVLLGVTAVLLALGMVWFSRREYVNME
jgi:ABC-type transport system involved in multi-copper enzyme maturation permease subunit